MLTAISPRAAASSGRSSRASSPRTGPGRPTDPFCTGLAYIAADPSGARSAGSLGGRGEASEGVARAFHDLVLLAADVEQGSEDAARGRGGGLGAEAAGLVGNRHNVARIRVWRERDVPRLVGPAHALLRGAGFAGDGDREALEHVGRGAARGARGRAQAGEDRVAVLRLDPHPPPRGSGNLLEHAP